MKDTQDDVKSRRWLRTAMKNRLDEFTLQHPDNPPRFAQLIQSLHDILDLNSKNLSKNPVQIRSSRRKRKVNYSEEADDNVIISSALVPTTTINNVIDGPVDLIDLTREQQKNELSIISVSSSNVSEDLEMEPNLSPTVNLNDSSNNQLELSSFTAENSDEIWLNNFPKDDDEEGEENVSTEGFDRKISTDELALFLPSNMKMWLESDMYIIKVLKKRMQIPSIINVIDLMEIYVRYYGLKAILKWWEEIRSDYEESKPNPAKRQKMKVKHQSNNNHEEKKRKRNRSTQDSTVPQDNSAAASTSINSDYSVTSTDYNPLHAFDQVEKSVDEVKSRMDDIRIMFDYLLNYSLLYAEEKFQYDDSKMFRVEKKAETNNRNNKVILPLILQCKKEFSGAFPSSFESNSMLNESPQASSSRNFSNDSYGLKMKASLFVEDLLNFRLLPDSEYNVMPTHPSLLFGFVHLSRLIVSVPQILTKMNMRKEDLSTSVSAINAFTKFLNTFGERLDLLVRRQVSSQYNATSGSEENSLSISNQTIELD